jgi:hypothetical protein
MQSNAKFKASHSLNQISSEKLAQSADPTSRMSHSEALSDRSLPSLKTLLMILAYGEIAVNTVARRPHDAELFERSRGGTLDAYRGVNGVPIEVVLCIFARYPARRLSGLV